MKIITILIIILSLLISCDCNQQVTRTVIDNETGRPLQGVTVYNKSKEYIITTTDSTGYFNLSNISGGFRCSPMTVIATRNNYY